MLKRSAEIGAKEAMDLRPFVCKETMGWSFLSEKMRYYN